MSIFADKLKQLYQVFVIYMPQLSSSDGKWFVVQTKSRCEKKVYQQLIDAGYQAYLPLQTTWRVWSDRNKKVELPLIPSVLFVENPDVNKERIYALSGVYNILNIHGKIGVVRQVEIDHLRLLCNNDIAWEQVDLVRYQKGDAVEIKAGAFKGHIATAIEDMNTYRVLLKIESLGTGFVVNLPKNQVSRI